QAPAPSTKSSGGDSSYGFSCSLTRWRLSVTHTNLAGRLEFARRGKETRPIRIRGWARVGTHPILGVAHETNHFPGAGHHGRRDGATPAGPRLRGHRLEPKC